MEELSPPRLLSAEDEPDEFDCGVYALNDWLCRRALFNHLNGVSRTYVIASDNKIRGYYCLSAASVFHNSVTSKIRRNMPDPIPSLMLGRLAVDLLLKGRGFGAGLLLHATERTSEAATIVGARVLLVNAKDQASAGFYRHFGFITSPIDELCLFRRIN